MPISADRERELLNKYKLTTLNPEKWPTRADDSSGEDSEEEVAQNSLSPSRIPSKVSTTRRSSVLRYRNIDRHASVRSSIVAADSESVVQKDEPDALGMAPSVATELKRRGLPVDDNLKLRNRFMLSSTTFTPATFLATVHQEASTDDLLRGLDYLSQSIEQKSASLKVLVESNFERFVKAKATIDNVYTEMRSQGGAAPDSPTQGRPHSRQTSKGQSHFRSASGRLSIAKKPATPIIAVDSKRKHALTKESEYGVQGIKAPLLDVAVKAEEVWGPAIGGHEREETMKDVVSALDQHHNIFHLSGDLRESIKKNDYDNIVSDYKQAKQHADAARSLASAAKASRGELSDGDARQIIVTAKMWHEVDSQITTYKRDVLRRLRDSHRRRPAAVTDETDKEEHMELIGVLIQLGVDDNPIWQWLNSRYLYLRDKIVRSFERARVELEVLRRTLANAPKTDPNILARYLRAASTNTDSVRVVKASVRKIDTPAIIGFWEKMFQSFKALLSMQTGVLGEVIEYWETAQSFIDNKAQKAFSNAVIAAGQEHLELEPDDVQNLRSGASELIQTIRENIVGFFSEPPVDDLSDLYSPIPPTPKTPDGGSLTPSIKRSFSFDPTSIPPASPKRGDAWEKFAFWPPQANSISGSLYLGRVLVLVGAGASEMASLNIVKQSSGGVENFRSLVGTVRERCIQAVCAAWDADAERYKLLETWTRQSDRRDLTTMTSSFSSFEEKVISNVQQIAYISEAMSARGSADVVIPPSAKLLQALRGAFVTSLYKALSGMVENAEKSRQSAMVNADPDGVTIPRSAAADGDSVSVAVDANNRNIRMLLTLSNLAHLRTDTIPHLISQFETNFSLKLTDESKTIRDVGGQIDARLFQSYVSPTVEQLKSTITTAITSPSWEPSPSSPHPADAKPYIYDILLHLVLVHSEVASTAPTLTNQILSYLLEQSSIALINAFKTRPKYTLPALMQATLDVEFLAQTLNNYTTDKAGEVQSQIYLALDERTDNESRALLQAELPAMRAVLKKLREGTRGQFGCFKRERRGRGGSAR